MDTNPFLKTARTLALQASEEILKLLKTPSIHHHKADKSPVTEADLISDKIIREGLSQAFPDHAILTEETDFAGNTQSEYVWVVDPLDGTKAYAKGIPGFCVMIGLLKKGRPYLGVVVDPLEQKTYEAIRGEGAWLSDAGSRTPLKVSSRKNLNEMPLTISTGFPTETLQALKKNLTGPLLAPINSVGIKIGLVVRQQADIYINHHGVSYWDTCAPQIILEEAGGILSRWDGTPLNYPLIAPYSHEVPTVASNGTEQDELVKILSVLKIS